MVMKMASFFPPVIVPASKWLFLEKNMQEQLLIKNIALTSMKYNSPKISMKPKKLKQGFQTKENDSKE